MRARRKSGFRQRRREAGLTVLHVADEAQGDEHRPQMEAQPLRGDKNPNNPDYRARRRRRAGFSRGTHVQKHAGRVGHHHGGERAEPESALEHICGGGGDNRAVKLVKRQTFS